MEQDVPEVCEARKIVPSVHLAAGHHNDHGFGHLLRVQIVHDIVGVAFVAPLADPGNLIAADSMMQVNDRIFLARRIPRRHVNRHLPHPVISGRIAGGASSFPWGMLSSLASKPLGGRGRSAGSLAYTAAGRIEMTENERTAGQFFKGMGTSNVRKSQTRVPWPALVPWTALQALWRVFRLSSWCPKQAARADARVAHHAAAGMQNYASGVPRSNRARKSKRDPRAKIQMRCDVKRPV